MIFNKKNYFNFLIFKIYNEKMNSNSKIFISIVINNTIIFVINMASHINQNLADQKIIFN